MMIVKMNMETVIAFDILQLEEQNWTHYTPIHFERIYLSHFLQVVFT